MAFVVLVLQENSGGVIITADTAQVSQLRDMDPPSSQLAHVVVHLL
jgi:hypothetical protein